METEAIDPQVHLDGLKAWMERREARRNKISWLLGQAGIANRNNAPMECQRLLDEAIHLVEAQ